MATEFAKKNECSPNSLYGPLVQTIFLGASVQSFSASAGWNEQGSSLTVELAEDPCIGPKVWYDNGVRRSGDIADPGFVYPTPGVPVYFRIEDFEFAGLVQDWTQKNDANGNPLFSVSISDPRLILDNTQIIVNDYPGDTENVYNLINAYGFIETLSKGQICTSANTCPSSKRFGGTSEQNTLSLIANERGMLWKDIKAAIHSLCSNPIAPGPSCDQKYLKDNRLIYVGSSSSTYGRLASNGFDNLGNLKSDYLIDLSEIPISPNYYRISGPTISMSELISQVCSDAGCDYYIELQPTFSAGLKKIIKVRTVSRANPPASNALDTFILNRQLAYPQAEGGIISFTKGKEVRNENTSIFIMGGKKLQPYQLTSESGIQGDSPIQPFWGVNSDNRLLKAEIHPSGYYRVELEFDKLNKSLNSPIGSGTPATAWVTEPEIRAALMDYSSFKSMTATMSGDLGGELGEHLSTIGNKPERDNAANLEAAKGNVPVGDIVIPRPQDDNKDRGFEENTAKDSDLIYDFVKSYAQDYYGKQFLVNSDGIPVCYKLDSASAFGSGVPPTYRFTHDTSNQAWVLDGTSQVLGLAHNSPATDFFRDEQGLYQPILRFPLLSGLLLGSGTYATGDPSYIGDQDYITNGTGTGISDPSIWVKAQINDKWVLGNNLDPSGDSIYFNITIPAPFTQVSAYLPAFDALAFKENLNAAATLTDIPTGLNQGVEKGSFVDGLFPSAALPDSAFCCVQNNLEVYGPFGVAGAPGSVSLENDDGLVPWEYGSDQIMEQAALQKVQDAATQMRQSERGSVTLAGFPEIPLGAELNYSAGLQDYIETRNATLEPVTDGRSFVKVVKSGWTGSGGPNLTNVNVSVGAGGFTTSYQFSTYTPQFGKFSKGNAERLKRIGQTRLQNMRNVRAKRLEKSSFSFDRTKQFLEDKIGRTAKAPKSAHHTLIGRITNSGRVEINSQNIQELNVAIPTDSGYAKTAIMSWDGIIRPVSKSGDGGLPRFISYQTGECNSFKTSSTQPPSQDYTPLSVTQAFLDPLSNPNSVLLTERSDAASSGHDFEILARKEDQGISGWSVQKNDDYTDDYRFMALRGPLMIQGWGYDTNSKPIPNSVDVVSNITGNGQYESQGLTDKFLDGFLQQPETWPVAPLDLRLDRKRGVWTVAQQPRPVHVNITGCLGTGSVSAVATATNLAETYDADGNAVSDQISITWPWGISNPTGIGKVPVYYDDNDCKNYVFPINRFDAAYIAFGDPESQKNTIYDTKSIVFSGFEVIETIEDCQNSLLVKPSGSGDAVFLCVSGLNTCPEDFGGYLKQSVNGCLAFGSGLFITGYNVTNLRVDTNLIASGTEYIQDGCSFTNVEGTVEKRFTKLGFAGNLSTTVDIDNDCAVIVSGFQQPISITNSGVCGDAEQNTVFSSLIIGTGLRYVDRDAIIPCEVELRSNIKALGTVYTRSEVIGCTWQKEGNPSFDTLFENLNFVGNISVTGDDCDVYVSGFQQPLAMINSGVCGRDNEFLDGGVPDTYWDILVARTGLKWHYEGEGEHGCTGILDVILQTSGAPWIRTYGEDCSLTDGDPTSNVFERIAFTGNLSHTVNGCTTIVSGFNNIVVSGQTWSIDYNDCNAYVASAPLGNGGILDKIIFTGELSTSFGSNCEVIVSGFHQPNIIIDTGTCGDEELDTYNADTFIFGTGLDVVEKEVDGKCAMLINHNLTISGYDLVTNPLDPCGDRVDGAKTETTAWEKIAFTGNISVSTGLNPCDIFVSGFQNNIPITGEKWTRDGGSGGDDDYQCYWSQTGYNVQTNFDSIATAGFISLITGVGCEVYLSGVEQPFRFIESGTCGSTVIETYNSKGLIFGSGLKASMITDSNCSGIVEVDIKAQGLQWGRISSPPTSCGWQPTVTSIERRFENLIFEGNLSVTGSTNGCNIHISGVQPSIKVQGLAECPSISAFAESDISKIRFGTGLQLTAGVDACDDGPRVDVKLIADGFDRRGGTPTAVTQRFTKINFGENLGIESNGTCEITVTGIQTNLTLSGIASCNNSNYLKETISTLKIGRGLKAENTNEVRLDLWFKGNEYTDSCTKGAGLESNTVTGIEFRDIALSENVSDCSLIVSGLKTVQLAGVDDSGSGCGTVVAPFDAKRLIFGTGLELVDNGCSGVVNSTLKVSGKDSTLVTITDQPVTSFNFLSDTPTRTPIYVNTDGCEITVSGGPARILVSGITSCGQAGNAYYSALKENLEFGKGLFVTDGTEPESAKIESVFYVAGDTDNGCGTTTAAASVTGLVFGSGLELTSGTCSGVVRTNLIAVGTDKSGGGSALVQKRFTKLKFHADDFSPFSIQEDSGDNCQVIVSGVPVMVTSGLLACGRAAVPFQISRGIGFGTGLQLNSDSQVNAVHKVQGTDRGGGSFTTQVFETLTFGSGLSSVNKSNCEVQINIDSAPVCISGLDTCGGSAVAESTYECIGIGTGLKITNNGASALIESNIQAEGTDKRNGGSSAIALQQFESLNFIGGISVHEGSECELFISGIEGISIIGDAACERSAVAEFKANTFEFGTGLQVVQDSNKVLVDSVINAAGDGFPAAVFENIVFEGGLSVSGDGCNVHVSGLDFIFSGINTCPKDGDGYLKESIQQISIGSGLIATNDASVGRIDLNLTASGLTYPVLEAYPCDTNAVQLDRTNFTSLNFVGNLSVEADPANDCRLLVSGIPSIFSGIGVCMRDVVAPFDACLLAVGTGLQLSERDGKAILNSTLTIQQPADTSTCYDTIADPTAFETISISGFGANVSDCGLTLTHKQNIKKTEEASCYFNVDGNSTFAETPFKVLDFGEGILAEVDGCVATIKAGMAGYANGGSCEAFDGSTPVTSLVTAVGAGYGIFAEIDNSAGCNAITFSQPLSLCSTNLVGQSITKSADAPYPDTTCSIIDCTDGTWNAGNGPFEERRPPKAWNQIVAGPGVGITAGCSGEQGGLNGDCTTIFYSNHILNGKTCDDQDVLVIQQFDWNYDCDFELTQSAATPSAQFDGADWTQSTIIKLSETNGGTNCWQGTIVTGCVSDGGYVTSCLTATIAGTASCNGKYWLKDIPAQWINGTDCNSTCQNPE